MSSVIYRWETEDRVVEIMAQSLQNARHKAKMYLDVSAYTITLETPGDVRNCSKQALIGDCVKTWTKH